MPRSYDEELDLYTRLDVNVQTVLYPDSYKKRRHIQVNAYNGHDLVTVSTWNNAAVGEDSKKPEEFICMTREEAIAFFEETLDRLKNNFDSRGMVHDAVIIKPKSGA